MLNPRRAQQRNKQNRPGAHGAIAASRLPAPGPRLFFCSPWQQCRYSCPYCLAAPPSPRCTAGSPQASINQRFTMSRISWYIEFHGYTLLVQGRCVVSRPAGFGRSQAHSAPCFRAPSPSAEPIMLRCYPPCHTHSEIIPECVLFLWPSPCLTHTTPSNAAVSPSIHARTARS